MRRSEPPRDPQARALASFAASSLTRRRLLSGVGLGLAGAGLAACAPPLPPASTGPTGPTLPVDKSSTEKTVAFANWTAYLDYDEEAKNYPTLEAFIKETGIQASYSEDIEDNDSYVSKIKPQLQANPPQDINRDIFALTDWMANRVIRDGLVQPLDLIRMPHAANLLDSLKDVSFDPGRKHSLTWQSGFAGIGYDKSKVGRELRSLSDLWADDLKGKVVALSEMRDTVGLIMQSQGVDISGAFTKDQVAKAMDEVSKRIADQNIRRIKGNSYMEDLKSGNAIAGIVWSGDLFVLRAETENENWEFVIPDSGGTLWSDNMMIPITSTHRRNAMALMDYYYRPDVAAQVAAYVNYVCPVVGAQQELAKTDPELAESPFIFPSAEWIAEKKIQGFRALDAQEDAEYSAMWAKVVGN
jgi:spermidine/putrescine transport system substrate-binding protein